MVNVTLLKSNYSFNDIHIGSITVSLWQVETDNEAVSPSPTKQEFTTARYYLNRAKVDFVYPKRY